MKLLIQGFSVALPAALQAPEDWRVFTVKNSPSAGVFWYSKRKAQRVPSSTAERSVREM